MQIEKFIEDSSNMIQYKKSIGSRIYQDCELQLTNITQFFTTNTKNSEKLIQKRANMLPGKCFQQVQTYLRKLAVVFLYSYLEMTAVVN